MLEAAIEYANQGLSYRESDNDPNNEGFLRCQAALGAAFAAQEEWDRAEPLLIEAVGGLREQMPEEMAGNRWYTVRACEWLIDCYLQQGKIDEADHRQSELAAIRQTMLIC